MLLFGPPMQVGVAPRQTGHGWIPAMVLEGSVAVSPVRKSTEESGRAMLVAPVLQITDPTGGAATAFSTHTLVGVLPGFGTASGAPKRHPADVQVRLLPVAVEVVPPIVAVWPEQVVIAVTEVARSGTANGSGTELPPPPV
jgi:hypothetical protein